MKRANNYRVAIIGCGLMGQKRARWISSDPRSTLETVVDINSENAKKLSKSFGCSWESDYRKALSDPKIDIAVVSTPNHMLAPIACEALNAGKNVLIEKPMGRNLKEAVKIRECAIKNRRKLKIGFNHRYHPALQKMYKLFTKGVIGQAINIRSQYGHGGRKGYEKEWRGDFNLAGGGELTDQGVHLIDLVQWFLGEPREVFSFLQTAYWPIRPSEDNGFVLMRYRNGTVVNFHTSWTQWKNLFNLEIFGTKGYLSVQGLGGSYGYESLTLGLKRNEGGVPKISREIFKGADESWEKEWQEFISGIQKGTDFMGTANEGISVMKTLDAIYRSHRTGKVVTI